MLRITNIEESHKEYEYCLRCGRKLKNPIARRVGYGSVCQQKMQKDSKKFKKLF